ncbi:Shr3 amino acid permease chaperone [Desarmillaria tabescens]|uniref:Shr3 amino acid permease chaperone n=1 Tax=Armillaria tabescens TaxID=1929756 RepID=A0AA39NKT7_ARMTA|nr:Shr3 amino acid permease chaperone [Desarmillaria tabescens]KAK0467318.1 Shr3 amino acid permease chaperone [Desarmillaria tabescens]
MGFRHAAVLGPVSFFLGILSICFTLDHALLWRPVTAEIISDGFQFYTTFFNAPTAIKALLHAMMGIGLVGLVSKLHKWDDSAMFFDGSSLGQPIIFFFAIKVKKLILHTGAYVFAIAVYLTVIIPTLRTIATPLEDETREDRIEAMRVLSAANVIIVVCLGGILALQAGQEWARRTTEDKEKKEKSGQKRVEGRVNGVL